MAGYDPDETLTVSSVVLLKQTMGAPFAIRCDDQIAIDLASDLPPTQRFAAREGGSCIAYAGAGIR